MEFSFSNKRWLTLEEIAQENQIERKGLGCHKPKMWDKIVDVEKCHLQIEPSNKIRLSLKQFAIKNNISFYNTRLKKGLLNLLIV